MAGVDVDRLQAATMCKIVEKSCDADQLKMADIVAAQLMPFSTNLMLMLSFIKIAEALGGVDSAGLFKLRRY